MVVLASFIGMPGLGQKLLHLLQALKTGLPVGIGIPIVLLAIVLDLGALGFVETRLLTGLTRGEQPWPDRPAAWQFDCLIRILW